MKIIIPATGSFVVDCLGLVGNYYKCSTISPSSSTTYMIDWRVVIPADESVLDWIFHNGVMGGFRNEPEDCWYTIEEPCVQTWVNHENAVYIHSKDRVI